MANLSTSDLRGIQPEHLGVLALPVAEFLALLHGTTYLGYAAKHSQQVSRASSASLARRTAARDLPIAMTPSCCVGASRRPQAEHAFFAASRGTSAPSGPGAASDSVPLITCTRASTLQQVLALMADHAVHRVRVGVAWCGGPCL